MNRTTVRLLAGATAIALAAPAFAQDAEESGEDIVVTAQRDNRTQVERGGNVGVLGDKPASDVPFAIKSYSETLILNQQPQTLGQVLENDPSIRLSYGFGNAAELFIVRGFPLFGDDIAIDGLYGITPRQLIAPELYDSVQVLNGASAFLNGAAPSGSGIGGSVNLALKRAELPLTRLTANFTESGHFGGAFDVARRFGDGALGVRVNGAYRAGDVSVDDEFRRTAVIGGGIDWRGGRARLSADIAYQRVEVRGLRPKVVVASATVPEPPRASANYSQPWTFTELTDIFGVVRGEYDLSDNAMVYASFGARDGSEDGIYSGITVTDALTGAGTGGALFVPRTDNNEAAQAGLRVKLAAGGISHEINFGGSLIRQVNRNAFDFLGGFDGFATNLYATPFVPLPGTGFVGGDLDDPFPVARVRLGSAFASDTIGLFGDNVLFTAGLRLQAINVQSYFFTDGTLDIEYRENAASPVVGLVVKPAAGLSLYANRIEGLAQGPTAPIDANLLNAGEVFAPYVSVQYEVGGKLELGRFNASLAVYQIAQPSAYTIATPTATNPLARTFVVDGEQRHRGIELSVDGELARGLRVIGGASITEARLRDTGGSALPGNTPVGVPDYTINANVEWDLPFVPGFTLTGRVVDTGAQFVDAANTLEIPGWTRVDLGARYVVAVADRPLTLRLTVDNVADNAYWQSAYDSFSPSVLQGNPRTVKLSASVEL